MKKPPNKRKIKKKRFKKKQKKKELCVCMSELLFCMLCFLYTRIHFVIVSRVAHLLFYFKIPNSAPS